MMPIDCEHDSAFINVPGIPVGSGGACGRCGAVVVGTYADLLRYAAVSTDYARDLLNTISSIEEEFPATKKARMDRRMNLRARFIDASEKVRQEDRT
jgi:hypothetical protein